MLASIFCALLIAHWCLARSGPHGPVSPRGTRVPNLRREVTPCRAHPPHAVNAPHENVFGDLTKDEAATVTAFLIDHTSLNLTGGVKTTDWDNRILVVETLQPNKSDVLAYFDSNRKKPDRYARARILFGATVDAYYQEWKIGPLPVNNATTTAEPLSYFFNNRDDARFAAYDIDQTALEDFQVSLGNEISDVTQLLFNATYTGSDDDALDIFTNDDYLHEDGRVFVWANFWGTNTTTDFIAEELLPTGLQFKIDVTGRDPSKWSVVAWWYAGLYVESLDELRRGVAAHVAGRAVDGPFTSTDQAGPRLPRDDLYPPVEVTPDGPRYGVDVEANYIEWMNFSFYVSYSRDAGIQFHNIMYKGERIIYELGLQEAVAHYASADPFQSTTAYLDSYYGIGYFGYGLVAGFDCPPQATFLNASVFNEGTYHLRPNAFCLFEHDAGYPIQRHLTEYYVSSTKNIVFTIRSISTVGNYDYIFDYTFHLDGSIFVTIRASGYIQSAYWVNDPEYGFHILDYVTGSMHDHVLNYKLDLDVRGTANSLMKTTVIPATETYPWSKGAPRNTMKLDRSFIDCEDDSQIDFAGNGVDFYAIVNKDKPNQYGEYPGWRLQGSSAIHTAIQNSSNLGPSMNWAYKDLGVVQRKDTEPLSAHPYNGLDAHNPVIDFAKFFDGESLEQQDLVVYFNLGMHHLPHTGDIPNTVTTTAESHMAIVPQNYFPSDASRQTIHQVRVKIPEEGNDAEPLLFGSEAPQCAVDVAAAGMPDLSVFSADVATPMYPFDASNFTIQRPQDE